MKRGSNKYANKFNKLYLVLNRCKYIAILACLKCLTYFWAHIDFQRFLAEVLTFFFILCSSLGVNLIVILLAMEKLTKKLFCLKNFLKAHLKLLMP